MKVKEIIKITKARLLSGYSSSEIALDRISTDSRGIRKGDIFLALEGPNFDGNKFVRDAFNKGASAAIVSKFNDKMPGKTIIKVADTLSALQEIAALNRKKIGIPLIGVTGSNGKTTVKELLSAILSECYEVLKNEGTKNNQIGVPQALLKLKPAHDICVLEFGTNHAGEIRRLSEIARPSMAVITNIGPSHLEFLKDLEGVYRAKIEILEFMKPGGRLIVNGDDRFLRKIRSARFRVVKFGLGRGSDFIASDIVLGRDGIRFLLNGKFEFRTRLLGLHNVYNALAAITAASQFKVDINKMQDALSKFKQTAMRLNRKKINGIDVLDDSYNSNPLSMISALDVLKRYPAKNRWVVSGDMLELGSQGVRFHEEIGSYIAKSNVDGLLTFGTLARHMLVKARQEGMNSKRLWHCADHKEMARILNGVVSKGDVVLFKGSRSMRMETVIDNLK